MNLKRLFYVEHYTVCAERIAGTDMMVYRRGQQFWVPRYQIWIKKLRRWWYG